MWDGSKSERSSGFFRLLLTSCARKIFCLPKCRGSSPVERGPEKAGVGSSTLPLGTIFLLRIHCVFPYEKLRESDPLARFSWDRTYGNSVLAGWFRWLVTNHFK